MRLIDADGLRRRIVAFCTGCSTTYLTVENIVMMINQADTVDAVPVVRFRDCIAFEEIGKHPTNKGGTPFGYCYHWQYEQGMSPNEVDGNDFCSYGERKDSPHDT
jgi:hypothetical protein|nr:MAG TPA: hypothetical protein [Caudoviricetes sp.]DAR46607.1 MAG TPA: hypothetical protein [Caudoviricetes sp.]DAZ77184.1 MAG TPA: hypothetical protein [Caudoviricetes sp.]